jgi:predicted HAD superfamily phosphohydrolase YqeG
MLDFFYNINTSTIKDRTIIIDIDGTLVPDGEEIVDERSIEVIKALTKKNELYLCSNKNIPARNISVSRQLGVPLIDTKFKKPNKKIIYSINGYQSKKFLVIGDKYIKDGIFAKRIGADFIKVKRERSGKESLIIRMTYLIDDIINP